jgi:hypothetical protein
LPPEPPLEIWPKPGVPTNPIVIPPPGPPAEPGKPGAVVIWVPGYGYVIVPVGEHMPGEPTVTPHA